MENPLSRDQLSDFFAKGEEQSQRVLYGPGSSERIGEHAKDLGQRVLLVTDQGLSAAGHPQQVMEDLEKAGLEVTLFDKSIENPTESSVQDCVHMAKTAQIDLIVGLGGGSSMDTAKGCNFILTNGGRMADYWGVGKATQAMLPLIALPTTAGTGSECQSFALISEDNTHRKMACGDEKALPLVTILDPKLTLSQPRMVTACTGIDALTHALESAVTNKRNDSSDRHSGMAFELIHENLPKVFERPDDLEARGAVLLGASHAGAAIERSMLGAAHSMANPLTALRGTVHGVAVGLALPAVMEFNAGQPDTMTRYADLARQAGIVPRETSNRDSFEALVARVRSLLEMANFPSSLSQLGFEEKDLASLAKGASEQWTAGFNPRVIGTHEFLQLYSSLFKPTPCLEETQELR
jgi:alcohol dehydrogenase